jgi:hypothetical protein
MWKVFGGIALAFIAWQVLSVSEFDLMTPECKARVAAAKQANDAVKQAIEIVKSGRSLVVGGKTYAPAKAGDWIEPQQAKIAAELDAIHLQCGFGPLRKATP